MPCKSCGTQNPEHARFCLKCGAAFPVAEKTVVAGEVPQPVQTGPQTKPGTGNAQSTPIQTTSTASGVDRFFGSLSVGLGSIVLALILAGIGYSAFKDQTAACSASIIRGNTSSSCYNNGYWSFFLAAFAVAGGGLKMASRIGKK
jgi:hypothetical protein